jgi:redox-sensitive bicupin YhaK (pirin superfamily)
MPDPAKPASLTLVHGDIDADERTTRLLFPTRDQAAWMPFERFAESMTTSRTRLGRHPHQAEEVVMYLLEGEIHHLDNSGRSEALTPGSSVVLTAHEEVSHELVTVKGKRARWLSIVVRLPWHTEAPPTSLQIKGPPDATEASDGTVQRPVVGPLARADAASGLQLLDLEFARPGTGFFRVGQDRRAVAYVLGGSGSISETPVDPGSGVLLADASGVAIHGTPGYRVVLASAPAPHEPEPEGPDPVRRRVK